MLIVIIYFTGGFMDIKTLLDLLPEELKNDKFFIFIKNMIIKAVYSGNVKVSVLEINRSLAAKVNTSSYVNIVDDYLMFFSYYLDDTIVTLMVDADEEDYYVKFEEDTNGKVTSMVLTKNATTSITEVLSYFVKNGYYEYFNIEAHHYDINYKELPIADYNGLKNAIFSDHFGIPENMAPFFREKFSLYSKYLSELKSEQTMRTRDSKLNLEDYFLFMPPFNLAALKTYMSDMFRENVGERIGEKLNENYLSCLYRVENIRDRLQELIGIDGEVVMSSNIYQNLIPILGGYEAEAYDMKGYIIKSLNGKYYFYEVSFKTLEIKFIRGFLCI